MLFLSFFYVSIFHFPQRIPTELNSSLRLQKYLPEFESKLSELILMYSEGDSISFRFHQSQQHQHPWQDEMSSTTRRWKLGGKNVFLFLLLSSIEWENENVDHIRRHRQRQSFPLSSCFFCFSLTRHFPQFASFSCSLFNLEMLELCSSGEIKWSEILVERNNDVNEAALSEGRSIECGKSINSRWNNRRFYSQYSWWWWWAQKTVDQKSQIHWDLFSPSFAIERSIRRTSMKSSQFNIQ